MQKTIYWNKQQQQESQQKNMHCLFNWVCCQLVSNTQFYNLHSFNYKVKTDKKKDKCNEGSKSNFLPKYLSSKISHLASKTLHMSLLPSNQRHTSHYNIFYSSIKLYNYKIVRITVLLSLHPSLHSKSFKFKAT